jgi:hypothetical protein
MLLCKPRGRYAGRFLCHAKKCGKNIRIGRGDWAQQVSIN